MLDAHMQGRPTRAGTVESTARRFVKFGTVGATGVVVNMAVFWLLQAVLVLHYLPAAAIAIELAICSNYLLNNNWTFREYRKGLVNASGLMRYHAVSFGGMLINLLVLHMLAGFLDFNPMVANLAGIGIATVWNFWLNVYWTWRRPRSAVPEPVTIRSWE